MPDPARPLDDDAAAERDFLLCILDSLDRPDPSRLVADALALVAAKAGAERAYLELGDVRVPGAGWSASAGFGDEDVQQVRKVLSSTIIQEALASGETIETASAGADVRFGVSESVRRNRIEAVLCAPVGRPPFGVVYLQAHAAGRQFPADARAWAERFARHLAPIARRLLAEDRSVAGDPTAPFRARLIGTEALVGRSEALAATFRVAATVAPLDVPVLLTGASGTGKSELARIIARASSRRDRAFVAINCAAIPDELLESELFGAHPGAHSTATKRVPGKVEVAAGGTLFLDEVAELSASAQAKLLQLLQDGTFWPLGSPRSVQADVRIIAATNAPLARRVAEGRFREDLFYRLDVVTIAVPGLEQRRTDIPALAERFLADARERHGLLGMELSMGARQALMVAEWPGNIRQLGNTVLGAAVRAHADGASEIEVRHCFPDAPEVARAVVPWQLAMRDLQRRLLKEALEATRGHVPDAARRLGIARSHAYELVKELGLKARSG
ncbi:MAG: sigma-54-dependent Fis family transcriptional regulator [Deltaproteobacteria bacterium]|nr:sigma-54-dependent Fis family transcriptional regulator [Deltaproteobacteria bacterium]